MIWTLALSLVLFGQAPASMTGKVLRNGTNQPIEGAQVKLTRISDTFDTWEESAAEVTTDEDGNFVFTGIEPGSYLIVAEKDGFATQVYGARRSVETLLLETLRGGVPSEHSLEQRATVIKLEAGHPAQNIDISLSLPGVISGRVRNIDGRPLVGVVVKIIPDIRNTGGVRMVSPLDKGAVTDDRGEFRLFDAAPGRYYIVASLSDSDEGERYAERTFYPGVSDFSRALAVDVIAGAEVRLEDISLLRRLDAFTISGRVVDRRGQPDDDFDLTVVSRHTGGMLEDLGEVRESPDGTFVTDPLTSGDYWIVAYNVDGDEIEIFGTEPVDISGSNIQGVTLTLIDPISVKGSITIDGKPPEDSDPIQQIRVGLEMKEVPFAALIIASTRSAKLEGDGTFSIRGLFPADFRAFATDLPPDMYLKNIRFGGVEALNRPIALAGATSNLLEIEIGTHGGELKGVILDDRGRPVPNTQAVLIPVGEDRHPDLYKTAYSDAAGRYRIRGVAPGDYTLLAWRGAEGLYFDAEYVQRFLGQAKGIRIIEDSRQTADIQVVPDK